jgi:hypothetical protein
MSGDRVMRRRNTTDVATKSMHINNLSGVIIA